MYKILFIVLMTGHFFLNAAFERESRGPVVGKICDAGVTFATEADAKEALERGLEDPRNPFVANVCSLLHSTKEGFASATITQIAPAVFLSCKHTAIELSTASQDLGRHLILTVQSGKSILRIAKSCVIKPHGDADIALIKIEFAVGEIPACDFLPLAKSIDDGANGSGFVVSCGEVSVAGKGRISEGARVLSIHQFQKKGVELESTLSGIIDEDQVDKMLEAIIYWNMKEDSEKMAELKAILTNANIDFPGTKGEQKSMRLMSSLRGGCSGSPLVIKQNGLFGIVGILTKVASVPKSFRQEVVGLNKENLRSVVFVNSFIDLTLHKEWIEKSIALLLGQ